MSHASLVLLGLLSHRSFHPYELEKEIQAMRLRQWAKVSTATIYNTLRRLEEEGYVTSREGRQGRRPVRTVYQITDSGTSELRRQVEKALRSTTPVYSDRLVGLVFLDGLDPEEARRVVDETVRRGQTILDSLEKEMERRRGETLAGDLVLSFCRNVYAAEQAALQRAQEELESDID